MSQGHVKLPPVVDVDKTKCTQCHVCIQVCPVKYCNDASNLETGITVNHDLCIGCGNCIRACTHDARYAVDDSEAFFNDLKKGENIAILVAPAVDVNFPRQLPRLLGWLKSLGVKKSFDVSFGADITTYQYLKAIKAGAKTPVISQPCPAVVTYIEIYRPELLPYLSPTGSPTLDIAAWVHHNHPGLKLAFISPCIAKKREFADPNTKNRVHYNVTVRNIKKYLKDNAIDLAKFPEAAFDGPMEAELGLLYSQPGGLYEAFKRYKVPLQPHQVRRTEGREIYDEFLEELAKELKSGKSDVVLVDILNCLHGCNRGTGTAFEEMTTDEVLKLQDERMAKHRERYYSKPEDAAKLEKTLESMTDIDFSRTYNDKSANYKALETPDPEGIKALYEEMEKIEDKDIKNCAACGYMSCEHMAKAIMNGLYRPQQCHHFLENYYRKHSKDAT